MTVTLLRLVADDREMVLHQPAQPRSDILITKLDVSFPAVRAVSTDRTDNDGANDRTTRHGARAVTLELVLFDTPRALTDELGGYLHPSARPWLTVADDEWAQERRIRLRVDQFSAPLPQPSDRIAEVQLQWQAPDGVWEASAETTLTITAQGSDTAGRTYPATWPRTYPATSATGRIDHINPGSTWADQAVRLYGPCAGPRYTSDLTGETMAFLPEFVIPAGEYVEINTRDRTANYMSDPDASRLQLLDFAASTWWRLGPGLNRIRYHPTSSVDVGSAAVITYHPAWL